jgi:MFS family permease
MPQLGSPVALIVSASIFTGLSYLPDEQFFAWGWRLPFLLSIILVGVGLFIRLRVAESPAFERVKETRTEASAPFLDTLRRYPTASLLASGLSIGILGSFYIVVTFTLAYATEQLGISRNISLIGLLAVGFVLLAFVPVFSALADRLGRRSILIASAAFLTLYAFPFFWLVDTGSTALVLLAMVVYGVAVAPLSGTSGALLSELFETRVRYTGISFGYQMGSVLGGAIAPFVSTALIAWSGGASWPVAIYLLVLCTICLICVLLASDKYRVRIFEEQPATPRGQGVAGEQRPMRAD